jgi:hypothetical protein
MGGMLERAFKQIKSKDFKVVIVIISDDGKEYATVKAMAEVKVKQIFYINSSNKLHFYFTRVSLTLTGGHLDGLYQEEECDWPQDTDLNQFHSEAEQQA